MRTQPFTYPQSSAAIGRLVHLGLWFWMMLCAAQVFAQNTHAGFVFSTNLLTANFQDQSVNATQYHYDFGDGTLDSIANPTHTYLFPGSYRVCLAVSNACCVDTFCSYVTVCQLPSALFQSSNLATTVNFMNLSSSSSPILSTLWDFGDGSTSTTLHPQHVYSLPGNYTTCLTTANACGIDTVCMNIQVLCPVPQVSFQSFAQLLSLNFVAASNALVSPSWSWDFGDGSHAFVQNPSHLYAQAGTYEVCVTVRDICGSATYATACDTVVVSCARPTAGFVGTISGNTLSLVDHSLGNGINAWQWDFGDGGTSLLPNPVYTYPIAGNYLTCLTVTNICGDDTICNWYEASMPTGLGIDSPQKLRLFPNPTADELRIDFPNAVRGAVHLSLSDALGKTIMQWEADAVAGQLHLSLAILPAGTYIFNVQWDGKSDHSLVVKR